jgi:hypothetical protein
MAGAAIGFLTEAEATITAEAAKRPAVDVGPVGSLPAVEEWNVAIRSDGVEIPEPTDRQIHLRDRRVRQCNTMRRTPQPRTMAAVVHALTAAVAADILAVVADIPADTMLRKSEDRAAHSVGKVNIGLRCLGLALDQEFV